MSLTVRIQTLSQKNNETIDKELFIKIANKYGGATKFLMPYRLVGDNLMIPFAFAVKKLNKKRRERSVFPSMNIKFVGSLKPEQEIIKQEAMPILSKNGSILLSMFPGFGKTCCSINIACDIKLKTLVIVNKLILITQWEQSIQKFCKKNVKITCLTSSEYFIDDSDFFIINAINIPKKPAGFFKDIGLCIVDECHLILAETLSICLECLSPRYLIGLSATPYREDGLDKLLDFYFGEERIIRELHKEHKVYKIYTGLEHPMKQNASGQLNWGLILNNQASDERRNEIILNIVGHFKKRIFLILSKRIDQATYIYERLKERGENVSSLIGNQQEFDRNCRVLVGITMKCGTGFDFARLDSLILGCDIEAYFIQSLGRIFRRDDVEPIVFDLVDANHVLMNHFRTRETVYKKIGGKIINFNKKYPSLIPPIEGATEEEKIDFGDDNDHIRLLSKPKIIKQNKK